MVLIRVIKLGKLREVKVLLIGCSKSDGLVQVNDLRVVHFLIVHSVHFWSLCHI